MGSQSLLETAVKKTRGQEDISNSLNETLRIINFSILELQAEGSVDLTSLILAGNCFISNSTKASLSN